MPKCVCVPAPNLSHKIGLSTVSLQPIRFSPYLLFLHLIQQLNFLPDVSGCSSLPCLVCNSVVIYPVFLIVTVQKALIGIVHPKQTCYHFLLLSLLWGGVGSGDINSSASQNWSRYPCAPIFFNKLGMIDHSISFIPSFLDAFLSLHAEVNEKLPQGILPA